MFKSDVRCFFRGNLEEKISQKQNDPLFIYLFILSEKMQRKEITKILIEF